MRIRLAAAFAGLLLVALPAPPAAALAPYIRFDYAGTGLKMDEGNAQIHRQEQMFTDYGLPAEFEDVGSGYGPGGSLGLWLFPALRVGASASSFRSVRKNHLHVPGTVFFADDLDFRMTEIGAEAAVRLSRLAGLTLGGNVAQGRAKLIEGYTVQDGSGDYFQDMTATRTRATYGAFVGIDQTNDKGLAGYVRVGYQVREMGVLKGDVTVSDGVTTVEGDAETIPLDYSGWYVRVGMGFDLVRR